MAFTQNQSSLLSGGENDRDTLTISVNVGNVQVRRSTAYPQTGAGCVDFDLTGNGFKSIVPAGLNAIQAATPRIVHVGFSLGSDVAPTSAAGVVYGSTLSPTIGGRSYVREETDRRLGIYDRNGTLLGKSITQSPVGASGMPGEWNVAFDGLNHTTVWVVIWAGNAVDVQFDTGVTWANFWPASPAVEYFFWGEWLPAGVNRGCHLYIDDGYVEMSSVAADGPHLVALPRARNAEPVNPTTIGFYSAWDSMSLGVVDNVNSLPAYIDNGELVTPRDAGTATAVTATTLTGTGAAPFVAADTYIGNWVTMGGRLALVTANTATVLTFGSWDGATPALGAYSFLWHDADRSHLQSTAVNEAFTVKSTDANPVPVGATILMPEGRDATRKTGGAKIPPNMRYRLGGVDVAITPGQYGNLSTTFSGSAAPINRPGGGTWVQGDFAPSTLEWGLFNGASGDQGARCSLIQGPTVGYYTATLPLSSTPTGAIVPEPNAPPQVEGGKGPLLRPDYNHAMRPTGLMRDIETIRRQTERTIRGERCGRSGSVLR